MYRCIMLPRVAGAATHVEEQRRRFNSSNKSTSCWSADRRGRHRGRSDDEPSGPARPGRPDGIKRAMIDRSVMPRFNYQITTAARRPRRGRASGPVPLPARLVFVVGSQTSPLRSQARRVQPLPRVNGEFYIRNFSLGGIR